MAATPRRRASAAVNKPVSSDKTGPSASESVPLKAVPPVAPAVEAVETVAQEVGALAQSVASLSLAPDRLTQIQQDYLQQATDLWNRALTQPDTIALKDRRFASPEWTRQPGSAFMASMYLLNASTLKQLADSLQGDDKTRERVRFAVQQWVDAASPANFLALNPEAQKLALDTQGESLKQGMQHLLGDIRQGHMSQTDESVFEVGRNVATTEGTVVFENPFFQLIEYKPLTEKVRERPFLLVPPCINKYYILDLQPENSLVRYALSQGQRVFIVSWVNADESLAQATWDDYTEQGVMRAIQAVQDITGAEQINALGFCIGGTLLAAALAVLDARGEHPVASLTLLTSFLDFVNTGTIDVFVDEGLVHMRELTIGDKSPQGGGLMKGSELATTFSFLRANDLVWNYVVGNYLKGETPPPFDLLYWNSDSTNLPGPMYCWYLRNTYLENKLKVPNALKVCGTPLDLRRLKMPTFVYGSREDHIVPWDSAYASTQLVSGPTTFVLGASGHIAGVINPPEKKKRSFWQTRAGTKALPATAADWLKTADEQPGSWWPTWSAWLDGHGGKWIKAPSAPGHKDYPAIEPAPGRYVKRRA
ncbi:MAG TPA: class I poly(R)-hydroxyalkanoic acid synthase [Candidatus Aquabacterium excrementipullorum]|nr:class I poly(R)-hydroxyalkanoic acid synthase [Candidatus Aquabacterium excrementipullorum]